MTKPRAFRFVVLLGWVSLFADLTHEGMRGAVGQYLGLLGASATAVGVVAGTGEALGYALRYATGALLDRTKRYWTATLLGYAANLVAIPLIAIAPSWHVVALLVSLERLGKAVRSPAKSVLTSFAGKDLGAGKAFAISEAMDQAGALLGPLLVAGVLAWRGRDEAGYAWAFALLGIPALATLGVLLRARKLYPDPRVLGDAHGDAPVGPLGARYRLYLVGTALIALGLADWPMLAYHVSGAGVSVSASWLLFVYAAAMGIDGLAALAAGTLFDRARARGGSGAAVVAGFVLAGAAYGPLVLGTSLFGPGSATVLALAGIGLWAIARSATESVGKSLIATLVPAAARGRAYGLYYVIWGVAWWAGSLGLGRLYDLVSPLAAGEAAAVALVAGAVVVLVAAPAKRAT